MKILVTGSAGFIGYHLTKRLLESDHEVIGLDNINHYYDINLKYARLGELGVMKTEICDNNLVRSNTHIKHQFIKASLEDKKVIESLFESENFEIVINLAAQAGVRYSIENPDLYIQSNIVGVFNLLEAARKYPVSHFMFASSSSVYGDTDQVPFTETMKVDEPVSLYAATKKSGEVMAYSYSHLYSIPITGLRFFTVYGPWGRPDMALSLFTDNILKGKPIKVFNNGRLSRDFTYISDIVRGMELLIDKPTQERTPPYQILNIGSGNPIKLLSFISAIERATGNTAILDYQPMQPGDVHTTFADVKNLSNLTGYKVQADIDMGVNKYVEWYRNYSEKPIE